MYESDCLLHMSRNGHSATRFSYLRAGISIDFQWIPKKINLMNGMFAIRAFYLLVNRIFVAAMVLGARIANTNISLGKILPITLSTFLIARPCRRKMEENRRALIQKQKFHEEAAKKACRFVIVHYWRALYLEKKESKLMGFDLDIIIRS